MSVRFILFLKFCALFSISIHAQSKSEYNEPQKNTSKYKATINEINLTNKSLTYNKLNHIYGREYKVLYPANRPTPFLYNRICKGSIFINGFEYPNLYLIYDVLEDEVILKTEHFNSRSTYIQINKNIVDSFHIESGQNSSLLINKTFTSSKIHKGFYECLYKGEDIKLYLKHKVTTNSSKGYDNFLFKQDLIIYKEGVYYKINHKRALLKQFWIERKSIRKKLKTYHSSYKKLTKEELTDLLHFINTPTLNSNK